MWTYVQKSLLASSEKIHIATCDVDKKASQSLFYLRTVDLRGNHQTEYEKGKLRKIRFGPR